MFYTYNNTDCSCFFVPNSNLLIKILLNICRVKSMYIQAIITSKMQIVNVFFRRKKLCIFGKDITNTADSPYAEIGNQPSGDSTYQELTESDMNKDYYNLALQ